MTYLPDLNTYLHQSSLLIQAYPSSRITTKYSLPRRPNPNSKSKATTQQSPATVTTSDNQPNTVRERREPAATLTLKTYHPETGICLKYRTDKAQEVGRLMMGLGKLAKGEMLEMPSSAAPADRMDLDVPAEEKPATTTEKAPVQQQQDSTAGAGGGGKKKKGKGKK